MPPYLFRKGAGINFKVTLSGSLYYYVFGLFANRQMGFLKIRGHQANISTRFAEN